MTDENYNRQGSMYNVHNTDSVWSNLIMDSYRSEGARAPAQ